jgi:hypothetical protein
MKTLAVGWTLACAVSSLAAQVRPRLSFAADAGLVRVQSQAGPTEVTRRGPALALEASILRGPLMLGVGYLGGRLPETGSLPARDLVEGRLFLGAAPLPWLALTAGPLVRAYVTDSATERWVLWQAHARARGPVVGTTLETYLELWRSLSAHVDSGDPVDRVQGGEVGMVFRPPRRAFWMRLGYRIDDARLGGGARRETVEVVRLAVGTGGP